MRVKMPDKWSVRTMTRFLLLPLTLPDRHGKLEKRWLETAKIVQKYEPYKHRCGAECLWVDMMWSWEADDARTT